MRNQPAQSFILILFSSPTYPISHTADECPHLNTFCAITVVSNQQKTCLVVVYSGHKLLKNIKREFPDIAADWCRNNSFEVNLIFLLRWWIKNMKNVLSGTATLTRELHEICSDNKCIPKLYWRSKITVGYLYWPVSSRVCHSNFKQA